MGSTTPGGLHSLGQAVGPNNLRVPHSIAFCAIDWGQDAAEDPQTFLVASYCSATSIPESSRAPDRALRTHMLEETRGQTGRSLF